MQKWEYRVTTETLSEAQLAQRLDQSGQEGWELVTVNGHFAYDLDKPNQPRLMTLILKRPQSN